MAYGQASHAPPSPRSAGSPGRCIFLVLLAFLTAFSSLGVVSAVSDRHAPRPDVEVPGMVGLDYTLNLPGQLGNERQLRMAFWAQLEQQGTLPMGTVSRMERAAVAAAEPPPSLTLRDPYLICDVTGDGVQDFVTNDIDYRTGSSYVRANDGVTGRIIWTRFNYYYLELAAYERRGLPLVQPPNNFYRAGDVNEDGTCDLLLMGFSFFVRGSIVEYSVYLEMVSGDDPYGSIWYREFEAVGTSFVLLGNGVAELLGFPTGFLYFDSPEGPRWIVKTTDYHWARVQDPVATGCRWTSVYTTEYIRFGDATNGDERWNRTLPFNARADRTNFTWLTGAGQLDANPEFEPVLDQYFFTNPTMTAAPATQDPINRFCRGRDPITDEQRVAQGRGMGVLALKGEDGSDLWYSLVHEELPQRANLPAEENFETLIWTHAQLLPDLTGDGTAEPVASWLSQEWNEHTTVNGRYRTHFAPLNGTHGLRLWNGSASFQGWGYAASVSSRANVTQPYLAIGTLDIPTAPPPGGRFPLKDVRLALLNIKDGTPVWTYQKQFPQDSMASYHLALNQYRQALAPHDWNGDGMKELVTPAQYVPALGATQSLLSTARQRYDILDSATGEPMATLTAKGPVGLLVACGVDEHPTVISGHSRRLDSTRFNISTGQPIWTHPIHNNPTPQSAVAGVDLNFLVGKCMDDARGRSMFGANMGTYSLKRGYEILPTYGIVNATGEVAWQLPLVRGDPLGPDLLTLLDIQEPQLTEGQETALNLVPALPGVGAGIGLGLLTRRMRSKGGSP